MMLEQLPVNFPCLDWGRERSQDGPCCAHRAKSGLCFICRVLLLNVWLKRARKEDWEAKTGISHFQLGLWCCILVFNRGLNDKECPRDTQFRGSM